MTLPTLVYFAATSLKAMNLMNQSIGRSFRQNGIKKTTR